MIPTAPFRAGTGPGRWQPRRIERMLTGLVLPVRPVQEDLVGFCCQDSTDNEALIEGGRGLDDILRADAWVLDTTSMYALDRRAEHRAANAGKDQCALAHRAWFGNRIEHALVPFAVAIAPNVILDAGKLAVQERVVVGIVDASRHHFAGRRLHDDGSVRDVAGMGRFGDREPHIFFVAFLRDWWQRAFAGARHGQACQRGPESHRGRRHHVSPGNHRPYLLLGMKHRLNGYLNGLAALTDRTEKT